MQVESQLLREPGERLVPGEMLAQVPKSRGRPRAEYRPVVRSQEDVDRLRRRHVPMFLLTSDWVTESGYPMRFRPWLVVSAKLAGKVSSSFRVLPVKDEGALQKPGLEELATFLLQFDPLAARVVVSRNRAKLNPSELYRRVRNEGLERAATRVRLQEFSAALPSVGPPLPVGDLEWVERNNPPLTAGQ
jgi:hypothetical protein